MSSHTEIPVVVDSTGDAPPAPVTSPSGDSANVALRNGITTAISFARKIFNEVLKPSIKSFIETSQTNPRVAAIVGTPALLAFLFTVAFLIFSTLTLVIWTIITVVFGIIFVIIGGLKALLFKLTLVVITAIPLAAVGMGLLVCGNSLAQIIITKLPGPLSFGGSGPSSADEVDWQKVAVALVRNVIQWSGYTIPIVHTVFETTKTVVQASYASLRTAAVLMHDAAARDAAALAPNAPPPPSPSASTENSTSTTPRPTETAPAQGDFDHELIIIEPVPNTSSSSALGEPIPTLHQRAPFRHTNDSDGN